MTIADDLKKIRKELTILDISEFKKVVAESYGISHTEIKNCTRAEIISKCLAIEEDNFFS